MVRAWQILSIFEDFPIKGKWLIEGQRKFICFWESPAEGSFLLNGKRGCLGDMSWLKYTILLHTRDRPLC